MHDGTILNLIYTTDLQLTIPCDEKRHGWTWGRLLRASAFFVSACLAFVPEVDLDT